MSPSDATQALDQSQMLLRGLCNFIVPLIQRASGQITMDAMQIPFGIASIEANEFIMELERFISGIISCSQPLNKDVGIETTMDERLFDSYDFLDNLEGTNWIWDIPSPVNLTVNMNASMIEDSESPEHCGVASNRNMIQYDVVALPISLNFNDKDLQNGLTRLRRHVTQNMPIRLLCFEPHNDKLKISLLERTGIYAYLSRKLRADFCQDPSLWMLHWIPKLAGYAILSHTWTQTPGELTYADWQRGSLDDKQLKSQKLVNFCKAAWKDHGVTFGWIDTVCINKESSAELDESIRSMYAWYSNAEICITYLAGTENLSDIRNDPWFTRGWTLQELVAPDDIKFYNVDWNQLSSVSYNNDRWDPLILEEISLATTMTPSELQHIRGTSISRRMQLAATRQVTRKEDIAYCLMGIFDVSISTAYGEGAERAFFRLVEEIFRSTKDVSDIFNWAGETPSLQDVITSLFPTSPAAYLHRSSNNQLHPWRPIEPLTLTHLGLRTPILLMPAIPIHASVLDHQPIGDYYTTVSIPPFFSTNIIPKDYHVLDKRVSGPEGIHENRWRGKIYKMSLAFGTLNVEEEETSICVPKTCLAVLLQRLEQDEYGEVSSARYSKVYTKNPIVFDLKRIGNSSDDYEQRKYYPIKRNQLANHGMQLVTLYL